VIVDWDAAERIFEEARGEPARISVDRWIAPTAMAHRDAQWVLLRNWRHLRSNTHWAGCYYADGQSIVK
jgi:hypothetical protein